MNRKFISLFGGAFVAASLTVAAYAQEGQKSESKEVTLQGELIDTACYVASDGEAKGKDHAKCASKCMGSGVPAAILPEGSKDATGIRFLLTNPVVLAKYAAQTIKVEGTEHAGMHAIDVKKLYVKDGSNWKEVQLQDEHHKMSGGADAAKDDRHKDHKH